MVDMISKGLLLPSKANRAQAQTMDFFQSDLWCPGFLHNEKLIHGQSLQIHTRMGNHVIRFELLSIISSPPLKPLLFKANHILQEPIRAILPKAPFSFFIDPIHTWLQIYSRFAAFLTPQHPIPEVACIKASLYQIFRQSFTPCCLSLKNCHGTVSSTRRIFVGFAVLAGCHQVRLLLTESHVPGKIAPLRSANIIQQ